MPLTLPYATRYDAAARKMYLDPDLLAGARAVARTLPGQVTPQSSANDAWVSASSATYPPTAGTSSSSSGDLVVERAFSSNYILIVSLLQFDTSGIPAGATINSATLDLYVTDYLKNQPGTFTVVTEYVANWTGVPTDGFAAAALANANAGIDMTTFTPTLKTVSIPLTNLSNIVKGGNTYLRLKLDGPQPTGTNYINFASSNDATRPHPKLTVSYTVPGSSLYLDDTKNASTIRLDSTDVRKPKLYLTQNLKNASIAHADDSNLWGKVAAADFTNNSVLVSIPFSSDWNNIAPKVGDYVLAHVGTKRLACRIDAVNATAQTISLSPTYSDAATWGGSSYVTKYSRADSPIAIGVYSGTLNSSTNTIALVMPDSEGQIRVGDFVDLVIGTAFNSGTVVNCTVSGVSGSNITVNPGGTTLTPYNGQHVGLVYRINSPVNPAVQTTAIRQRMMLKNRTATPATVATRPYRPNMVRKATVQTLASVVHALTGGGGPVMFNIELTAQVHIVATRQRMLDRHISASSAIQPVRRRMVQAIKTTQQPTAPVRLRMIDWNKFEIAGPHARGVVVQHPITIEVKDVDFGKVLSGRYGNERLRARLYVCDEMGNGGVLLKGVRTASVSMSNERDDTWNVEITLDATDALDPVGDYVMLTIEAKLPDGRWEEWPMGIYRFTFPSIEHMRSHSVWSLTGQSKESLVMADSPDDITKKKLARGRGVLDFVRQGLIDYGFDPGSILFPDTDVTVRNDVVLLSDEGDDVSYLLMWNKALKAGGFYPLATDKYGNWITTERDPKHMNVPDAVYTSEAAIEGDRMIVDSVSEEYDNELFANSVVVRATDIKESPPLVVRLTNADVDSSSSTVNLKRRITRRIDTDAATTVDALNRIAQTELQKSSGFHRRLTLRTLPDPRRDIREVYELDVYRMSGDEIATGLWNVSGWTMELAESGRPQSMEHDLSNIERVF